MQLVLAIALVAACGASAAVTPTDATSLDARFGYDGPDDTPVQTCGTRAGMRGKTSRTVHVVDADRTYLVYLPKDDDSHAPVPLVFVHHGYTMSGAAMFDITGYAELADREHVAVAFPDGQHGPNSLGAPWNVGSAVCPAAGFPPPVAPGDDFAFLDAMRADISLDQCIDAAHVFVTGFSMGGYFSHQAGCMRGDIRAVAPHSGGTHALDGCATPHVPIIMFHGTSDPIVPPGCSDPHASPVGSTQPAATAWAMRNGCLPTATATAVDHGTCYAYDGCPAGAQVTLCTFDGMGHCWAGGQGSSVFACAGYASATELEWSFFKQHAW